MQMGGVKVISKSLKGLVVLDFGQLIAAPVCGMWLADLGATVIKIEPPHGELARHMGPPSHNGESFVLLASNRNKLGMILDLKHDGAGEVVNRMVRRADILLQNFRPDVAERLGLGWEKLKTVNPDLIYCAISAYGQDNPWRERPGVDGIVQAASGIMSVIEGRDGPGKVPLPLADMTGAMFATMSIMSALRVRDGGHGGSFLDIDLFGGMIMLQQLSLSAYLTSGELPEPSGSAASYAAPNEVFPTMDGWVMVAAYQPSRWKALCVVLGCTQLLDDARFSTNADRVANRDELHQALDPVFRTRTAEFWTEILLAHDVMASAVASYADVVASAPYKPEKNEVRYHHPTAGWVKTPGFVFGDGDPEGQGPAPCLGQHSREALGLLGFDTVEIENLMRAGIIIGGGHDG